MGDGLRSGVVGQELKTVIDTRRAGSGKRKKQSIQVYGCLPLDLKILRGVVAQWRGMVWLSGKVTMPCVRRVAGQNPLYPPRRDLQQ